jgi:hypothetical protein
MNVEFGYYPSLLSLSVGDIEIPTMLYASRVFGLPKTHTLKHEAAEGGDHLAFLLWALSFIKGTSLTATQAGCRCRSHRARQTRTEPMRAKRFAAAVRALFLGQNPRLLQFECFIFLYAALDACFALARHLSPKCPTHADRIT